ncbi:MAG: betaine/proline/choline family ABC transporter ATP-binding protein [Deltaproteobacteria bacterium]|jgi:osmoprotectant transport system ATP-binding protein|nr:betaine/proline/choline family ABC transporter ATP-binding protein [Deltaproteobacteria bacterium]
MIKLERVTKIYPDGTKAVREVSLDVKRGELCVLLGPSGCGKTTTMKMINRLIPLTSGKIYVNGVDHVSVNENELRRNIGYAIQEVGLFPHMTVAENITTVPALKGWTKADRTKRVLELLRLLRMPPDEFINKYPKELSGGQRQRIGIARALGADPPILLMDEPFGAIDPVTRIDLQNEFLRIQKELNKTIIFVTHDIYEAVKMADSIALMKEGQLVQHSSPADLLYRPKNRFAEDFVGSDRGLKGLQLIRAREAMWDSPATVTLDAGVESVRKQMEEEGIDWLAVISDDRKFLGWVISSHLVKGHTVSQIITVSSNWVTGDAVLSEALSQMLISGLKVLAVVDQHERLEGVLTFEGVQTALRKAVHKESTE